MHCSSFHRCWIGAPASFLWHISEEAKELKLQLGDAIGELYPHYNRFWGIRLNTPCANAQSRSPSLLLPLSPLVLGTCSTSYTMPNAGVIRWAVGCCFSFFPLI